MPAGKTDWKYRLEGTAHVVWSQSTSRDSQRMGAGHEERPGCGGAVWVRGGAVQCNCARLRKIRGESGDTDPMQSLSSAASMLDLSNRQLTV
jgi:hypothetical protein